MKRIKTLAAVSLLAGAPLSASAIGHGLVNQELSPLVAARDIFTPNIDVKIDHGVLTLYGQVNNEIERAEAENTAYEIDGIFEVRNRLVCVE